MTIRTKDDVEHCYHERRMDNDCPHVKVKVYRGLDDVRFPLDGAPAELTLEWIRANLSEERLDQLFWDTCSSEWEMLQQDAEEIFGKGVKVNAGGRSGGWACVVGLDDIESWDAIMLAKWKRFARYAGIYAKGIPEQMVYNLAVNEWEWAKEEEARKLAIAAGWAQARAKVPA